MEKGATFMKDNLSGYNLPAESLAELRSILTRRFSARFSDGLSSEGRAAMKEASEIDKETDESKNNEDQAVSKVEKEKQKRKESQASKTKPGNNTESSNKNARGRPSVDASGASKLNKQQNKKEGVANKTEVSKNPEEESEGTRVKAVIDGSANNNEPDSVEKCLEWMVENNQVDNGTADMSQSTTENNDTSTQQMENES